MTQNNAESDKWLLSNRQNLSLFTWGCLFIVQCTVPSCHYFDLWGFPFSPIEPLWFITLYALSTAKLSRKLATAGFSPQMPPRSWVKADRSRDARWGWPASSGQRWHASTTQRWQRTMFFVHLVYLKAMIESGIRPHSESILNDHVSVTNEVSDELSLQACKWAAQRTTFNRHNYFHYPCCLTKG